MKIVQLVPGSGATFYCENCLRDTALVRALAQSGHDPVMVPLYLPLFTDDPGDAAQAPVFFGGINAWLQQNVPAFRRTPRWVDRMFDARWVLALAARKAGTTRPAGLGEMTLSMLRGRDGRQVKEVDRLTAWLVRHERPDIVHLSNALLLGLARPLREALGVPVVCTLQDEDTWLDALDAPYDRLCWEAVAEQARHVDAFVSVSRYYAAVMQPRLGPAAGTIVCIPPAIDAAPYRELEPSLHAPTIGFLARMNAEMGLDRLVDAYLLLRKRSSHGSLRLRVSGGHTPDDAPFLRALREKVRRAGCARDVDFVARFDREARAEFLSTLTVFSVPRLAPEAFGLYLLEALAAGIPSVQPRVGAFPEVLEATGGGVLYEPNTPETLAAALETLLLDPTRARELGRRGRAAVFDRFGLARAAGELGALYARLAAERS